MKEERQTKQIKKNEPELLLGRKERALQIEKCRVGSDPIFSPTTSPKNWPRWNKIICPPAYVWVHHTCHHQSGSISKSEGWVITQPQTAAVKPVLYLFHFLASLKWDPVWALVGTVMSFWALHGLIVDKNIWPEEDQGGRRKIFGAQYGEVSRTKRGRDIMGPCT